VPQVILGLVPKIDDSQMGVALGDEVPQLFRLNQDLGTEVISQGLAA
jgi:hypothetical protein